VGVGGVLELRLLGGFEARREDRILPIALSSAELLSLLILCGRRGHRPTVAGTLWPDKTEARAHANRRGAVWRLADHGAGFVFAVGGWLHLTEDVVADVEIVECQSRQLINGIADSAPNLAIDDLEQDLLPTWDQSWVLLERERFRQLRLYVLEALANHLVSLGRIAEAVLAAVAAVQADPLRESAHRALISAHLADGNRGEAARQYQRFRELLGKEMGIQPTPHLAQFLDDAIGQ
jgi:DNA-binding SARP family transcriptional activator